MTTEKLLAVIHANCDKCAKGERPETSGSGYWHKVRGRREEYCPASNVHAQRNAMLYAEYQEGWRRVSQN
jgi:hypothetical protein